MNRSFTRVSKTVRSAGWLAAAMTAGGLTASCAADGEPITAAAQSAELGAHCPDQFVTGYYAGYYAFHPDYQAPQHVDMTAMTHLVFARIAPGGAHGTIPGKIVLGNMVAQKNRNVGPGAPHRTIEEYLIGRAHQVGTKALIMLGGVGDEAGFRASLDPAVRPTFIENLLDYMESRDYDGVDVDFEGFLTASDQALLEAFIPELRAAANARPRYAASPVIITYPGGLKNMNIDQVTPHDRRMVDLVDQYSLMSYGAGWYGQGWTSTTHSPLTGHTSTRPMSIASTIQAFVAAGAPRCKLGMGIGFYGMMYKPPFTAPGQSTDDGDHSKWSTNDNIWNFAQLTKNGYLANGTYVWDPATQTGYRSYPGGYTAPGSSTTVGYISYEDEAGIEAKGAWSQSAAPTAGAGGTIIWLVNYGTTNAVNNPLLTAVKRAFLDPAATEPGPNPNPGPLPDLPDAAEDVPGDGSGGDGSGTDGGGGGGGGGGGEPLPQIPTEDLSYTRTVWNTWDTGYCADVTVTNNGSVTGTWIVEVPFTDTIDSLWEGTYTTTSSSLLISGPHWDPALAPVGTRTVGYCANLGPTPPPGGTPLLTGTITIFTDWGSGWCARAEVSNTGDGPAAAWSFTLPKPSTGTFFSSAFPYTQTATHVTISGGGGNPVLDAGESTGSFDMCASR